MTTNKLDTLLQKKKQLENQIQLAKARETEKARKQDTRRKILIGAVILAQIKQKKFSEDQLNQMLDDGLVDERDRILFNLQPKKSDS